MYLSGAEILIEEIAGHGVDTVFGYPGSNVLDIYDALFRNSHRITHILTAHEQGAAHAADAYARVSGKTGVVIATSGPGATNLVTGIANAYLDSVPVVFFTGDVPAPVLGRDSFQEIDVMGVTLPLVKHSYVVRKVEDLQHTIREAFLIADTGRKGPVLIDIPKNIQLEKCEYTEALRVELRDYSDHSSDLEGLDAALDAINGSKRPYIYCGGGVAASAAGESVVALSKKLGAPVGSSLMGIGAVPSSYEMNLGMCGAYGRRASNKARLESDLIIALGVRFSDRSASGADEYSEEPAEESTEVCRAIEDRKVIHIDIDAAEFGKNVACDIYLRGDLSVILPMLVNQVDARYDVEHHVERSDLVLPEHNAQWLRRVHELKSIDMTYISDEFTPRSIINCVNACYNDDTPVATDVGQHQMWVAQFYGFEKPRRFISSGGLGAMGFGLGAAIGASLALNKKRTVLFTGEGSFGMNLNEMATAVSQELPITIVLLNNGVLGMVRQMQSSLYDARYSQTTLDRKTDFPALAEAFGAKGKKAENLAQLNAALVDCPDNGPCLIECVIDKDEIVT